MIRDDSCGGKAKFPVPITGKATELPPSSVTLARDFRTMDLRVWNKQMTYNEIISQKQKYAPSEVANTVQCNEI